MTAGLRITMLLTMALGACPLAAEILSGRVLEDHSGDPLAAVVLRLTQVGQQQDVAALETDANGRFHAEGITAGEYTIEVSKPNYVPVKLHLNLDTGAKPLLLRLIRYGVIAGQVTDSDGRAPRRTMVFVVKRGNDGKLQRYARQTMLEESGAFRIFNLPPGEYALAVQHLTAIPTSGVASRPMSGFKLRLYPDNQAPRWFPIEGGEEYTQINFNITAERLFRVSGLVRPSDRHYFVMLRPVDLLEFVIDTRPAYDESDSGEAAFEFDAVPAGSYHLLAVEEPSEDRLLVRSRVDVVNRDIEGLALTAGPGLTASFILERNPSAAVCPIAATLALTPLGDQPGLKSLSRTVDVKLTEPTVVTGLAPGSYLTALSGLGSACFGSSERIELDGSRDQPIPLTVSPAALLKGRLIADESPPADYLVLLTASETSGSTPAVLIAKPNHDASFSFAGLRPGRYTIAVVPATVGSRVSWADVPRMMELDLTGGTVTEIDLPIPVVESIP